MNPARDRMPPVAKFARTHGRQWQGVHVPSSANVVTVYGLFFRRTAVARLRQSPRWRTRPAAPRMPCLRVKWSPSSAPISDHHSAGLQLNESGGVATSLADTQVLFDGVPSSMIFASDGQVNRCLLFRDWLPPRHRYKCNTKGQCIRPPFLDCGPYRHRRLLRGHVWHRCGGRAESGWQPQFAESTRPRPVPWSRFGRPAPANSRQPELMVLWCGADNPPVTALPVLAQVGGQIADVLYSAGLRE